MRLNPGGCGVWRGYPPGLLLDAGLHHAVLTGAETGAGQVTLKDERWLDLIELLQQPLVLEPEGGGRGEST